MPRTLSDQIEEYSLRKGKIEKLTEELVTNPFGKIFYDEDEDMYFITGLWDREYPINVELRERLPNSYFHSPESDKDIIGYDPIHWCHYLRFMAGWKN